MLDTLGRSGIFCENLGGSRTNDGRVSRRIYRYTGGTSFLNYPQGSRNLQDYLRATWKRKQETSEFLWSFQEAVVNCKSLGRSERPYGPPARSLLCEGDLRIIRSL
jgi:hypothetical protein